MQTSVAVWDFWVALKAHVAVGMQKQQRQTCCAQTIHRVAYRLINYFLSKWNDRKDALSHHVPLWQKCLQIAFAWAKGEKPRTRKWNISIFWIVTNSHLSSDEYTKLYQKLRQAVLTFNQKYWRKPDQTCESTASWSVIHLAMTAIARYFELYSHVGNPCCGLFI